MEQIPHLTEENFDLVIKSGKDLVLFFYKPGDAASILGLQTMSEVFSMIGRTFDLYLIDTSVELEISEVFMIQNVPEYISMKKCKIYKRSSEILSSTAVLALLRSF